jgi:hypothetical protein
MFSASPIRQQGPGSLLAAALGKDWKGKLSLACCFLAVPLAFVHVGISSVGMRTGPPTSN